MLENENNNIEYPYYKITLYFNSKEVNADTFRFMLTNEEANTNLTLHLLIFCLYLLKEYGQQIYNTTIDEYFTDEFLDKEIHQFTVDKNTPTIYYIGYRETLNALLFVMKNSPDDKVILVDYEILQINKNGTFELALNKQEN